MSGAPICSVKDRIRTRNIFLTIGIHALANFLMPIFAIRPEHELLVAMGWFVPETVVVILWPMLPFNLAGAIGRHR